MSETLTWTEFKQKAEAEGGRLPTKEEIKYAGISAGNTDAWIPIRREDGKINDWTQIGVGVYSGWDASRGYCSYIDKFGEPAWGYTHNLSPWRPSYFYVSKGID